MRLIPITLTVLALLPAAAAAQSPTVATGPAGPVGETTATLTGTVDPNGSETTYRFEYGTTTDYGLLTPEQTAGAGDDPVTVQAAVQGLTAATTYHFRLVAGGVAGADGSFTTGPAPLNPAPPGISGLRASDRTATSARLTARIDPNRAATGWYVEWGTSTSFGNRTAEQLLPAGDGAVGIATALEGLPPHQRIYWRVVATNAAGTRRSGRTSFTTLRAPTGVALSVFPALTTWSGTVSIGGRVEGAGVNGLAVALQQTSFPFSSGFHEVDTARTSRTGAFTFAPQQVFIATRYRAVVLSAPSVTSTIATARARARVGIRRTQRTRRTLRLTGRVNPGLPAGRATLHGARARAAGRACAGARCRRATSCTRPTASGSGAGSARGSTASSSPRGTGRARAGRSRALLVGARSGS